MRWMMLILLCTVLLIPCADASEHILALHEWGVFDVDYQTNEYKALGIPENGNVNVRKPIIYLYPAYDMSITVRVGFRGNVLSTIPLAEVENNVIIWDIDMEDGHIYDRYMRAYDYLFYEVNLNLSGNIVVKSIHTGTSILISMKNNYEFDIHSIYGIYIYKEKGYIFADTSKLSDYIKAGDKDDGRIWLDGSLLNDTAEYFESVMKNICMDEGLSMDETEYLLDCWMDEWFKLNGTESLKIIFFIDEKTYDNLLPIVTTPDATEVVRTGIFYVHSIPVKHEEYMRGVLVGMGIVATFLLAVVIVVYIFRGRSSMGSK